MEAIADPSKIIYTAINLLQSLPVFGPQNDNFGILITFNRINAFHHNMIIEYAGNNQFSVNFRHPPNPVTHNLSNMSKENLLKMIKTLTKKFIIANIDFNSIEHANNLFHCSTRDCLNLQNFYANKFIKPKVDRIIKVKKIKAARVIQSYAIPRYNNPARPNVHARHLREIAELNNDANMLNNFGKRKKL